jgi:hypothetical protein
VCADRTRTTAVRKYTHAYTYKHTVYIYTLVHIAGTYIYVNKFHRLVRVRAWMLHLNSKP